MKKNIVNILATTGISLLLLSVVALSYHGSCIYLETVFQTFGVNIITHLGIIIIKKIELRTIFTEMVLEITFIVCELLVFGRLFHWFTSLSFLLLVCMGVVIYIISLFLNLLQMKHESKEINFLIKTKIDNYQNYSEEKGHGKKKNNKCYQYDVYFIDDY